MHFKHLVLLVQNHERNDEFREWQNFSIADIIDKKQKISPNLTGIYIYCLS